MYNVPELGTDGYVDGYRLLVFLSHKNEGKHDTRVENFVLNLTTFSVEWGRWKTGGHIT